MDLDTASAKMSRAYASAGGKNVIPWASIIQMIMSLLGGCTPANAKKFGKAHPLALEFLLRSKLKEESSLNPNDIKLVAKISVDQFNKATVADITELSK